MKVILSLLLLCGYPFAGQQNSKDQFKEDFERIASVFEANALPYIRKFTNLQVGPLPNNPSSELLTAHNLLIETRVMIHSKKLELMKNEAFKVLESEMGQSYSTKENELEIIRFFEAYYQGELLYLDHTYYKTVKDLLRKK